VREEGRGEGGKIHRCTDKNQKSKIREEK